MMPEAINKFEYKGRQSSEFGLFIISRTPYNAPERSVIIQSIPGRDGDLLLDNGRYENVQVNYRCNFVADRFNMHEITRQIKAWLCKDANYYRLTDTYSPDYYRMAACYARLDIAETIRTLGEVNIAFNCKPFLYRIDGERTVTLTKAGTLINPEAFPSKPYIKITGSGTITLTINNDSFPFQSVSGYIEVDSDTMNAYKDLTPQNSKMRTATFPTLYAGANAISWTGSVSKVEIIPRWCTL